jgi:hypothetical protein
MPYYSRKSRSRYGRRQRALPKGDRAHSTRRYTPTHLDLVNALSKYHDQQTLIPFSSIESPTHPNFLTGGSYNATDLRYDRRGFMYLDLGEVLQFWDPAVNPSSSPVSGLERTVGKETSIQITGQTCRFDLYSTISRSPNVAEMVDYTEDWTINGHILLVRDKRYDDNLNVSETLPTYAERYRMLRSLIYNQDFDVVGDVDSQSDIQRDAKLDYPRAPMVSERFDIINKTTFSLNPNKRATSFDVRLPARRQMFFDPNTFKHIDGSQLGFHEGGVLGERYFMLAICTPMYVPELATPPDLGLSLTSVQTSFLQDI